MFYTLAKLAIFIHTKVSSYQEYCYLCAILSKNTNMANLKQASISKSRSYTACLSEAHKMLFDNIKLIFSKTWIYSAVLALLTAAYTSLCIHAGLYGDSVAVYVWIGVSCIATLCAEVAYLAKIISLINGRSMKWNVVRCARIMFCYLCFCAFLTLIYTAATYLTIFAKQPVMLAELQPMFLIFGASLLVIALLLLPYVYIFMKYLMEPECKLRRIIFKSYGTGMRYWGLTFIAMLLAVLCTAVCATLVSLPALIVMAANAFSVFGVNFLGDPTGLPSYFGTIQFVVFALSAFICLYINIFTIFVCYFLYGSIETREREKKKFMNELQTKA